jgi:hypothetical protein
VKDRARGINGLKNRSGKCEGPGGGDRRVKKPKWEMRRTGRGGLDKLKNRNGKCEGPGGGGGRRGTLQEKHVFSTALCD